MNLQKTRLINSKEITELEKQITDIILQGGVIDIVVSNQPHYGWLIIYTPV